MASRASGKRLPISCQACRTRKIRCSRDGRPCQTCVRRGLGAEDCIYLGQPRLSVEQSSSGDATAQNELLARIRNLEGLLQKQVASQAGTPSGGAVSPLGAPSVTGSFSESEMGLAGDAWDSWNPMLGNIGSLQTTTSGHVRYVPLMSQWESVVAKSAAADCLRITDSDIPEDDDDLQIPLARNGSVSRAELLAFLPPGRHCDTLKDVYFRVFSTVFHILHDLTFEAEYQHFCHDPSSVSTSWLALLFAILAIAVNALDDDDPLLSDLGRERTVSRNIKVLTARYRSAALRCLAADGVVSRHSINSLQALVLINYARINRGLPIWTLLGFTHHVAISMGCHIDPERFALGAIEREERRRVWAGLMMLYTIHNSSFGSLDQQMIAQDVRMPADVDDVDLLTGPSASMTSDLSPGARPTQMTHLLLTFRLYRISAKVCETIFSAPHASRFSVAKLEAEILAVRETCDARYLLDTSPEPISLPVHHQANLNILYSHVHQLFLLLLRPTLCRYLQGELTPDTCASRAKCVVSAKASLTVFQTLFESLQFAPYKWYTCGLGSFHAFHAAVVLAVILLTPESQAEFEEIKAVLDRALDVFAALSVRSVFCSRAVPVVRQILYVPRLRLYFTLYPSPSPAVAVGICPELTSHSLSDVACTNYYQQKTHSHLHASTQILSAMRPSISPAVTMPESFVLSHQHSQSQSPVPTIASSESDPSLQSSFGAQLQPQNWLGPTSVPWDALGPSMNQFGFDGGSS
ncbi:hypothetical protein NUU61_008803 [Penicillium alfredii]|uniref:Zn(2)-C6 fungal-type domain-containing protein n=1 Tax=Penicillium alfredii TaxID=1506179 RepID=A0A9W9JWA8_9EURO|nr:uncharacterized protein NUU61_008803 [Penicillium alfredii]KAJ5084224.1 hypothetical protein NUU61_008803 [Penicillium alfredii]